MELKEALEAFERLEARRYSGKDIGDDQAWSPVYNVRLDAMSADRTGPIRGARRSFRIFVRVDKEVPAEHRNAALAFVVEVASEFGLEAQTDNGGVSLM